jgi:hypothetical protein
MSKAKPLKMNPAPPVPSVEDRLAELGITLPVAAAPVAAYVPAVEACGSISRGNCPSRTAS